MPSINKTSPEERRRFYGNAVRVNVEQMLSDDASAGTRRTALLWLIENAVHYTQACSELE